MAVARKTCDRCHHVVPRNTMRSYEYTERTGHSNGGFMSFNLTGKANPRAGGSRRHYHRIKTMYLCGPCASKKAKDSFWNFVGWITWKPVFIIASLASLSYCDAKYVGAEECAKRTDEYRTALVTDGDLSIYHADELKRCYDYDWMGYGEALYDAAIGFSSYVAVSVGELVASGATSLFDYVWSLV